MSSEESDALDAMPGGPRPSAWHESGLPPGLATASLDHAGFAVRTPARVANFGCALLLSLTVQPAMAMGVFVTAIHGPPSPGVALAGLALCMVLTVGPWLLLARSEARIGVFGVRALRCTPTELVARHALGTVRIPLASVRAAHVCGWGSLAVRFEDRVVRFHLRADRPQVAWIAEAIVAAASGARRVGDAPAVPEALLRARAGVHRR